jgi:hypothetical protein
MTGREVKNDDARFWHLADNPVAPTFVRFWTKADNGGFWLATACPLLTDTVEKGLALIGEQ